jgi:precorrin-2 dehydrogenase/sirohydrochlorin ferrochelatase
MSLVPPRRFDYPLSLCLDGERALVIGGDYEAVDKAKRLVRAGAALTIVAETPGPELRASGLPFEHRPFHADDAKGMRVVIVAPDARALGPTLWAARREHGFLLSTIDDSPFCDFASPSFVDVGDVKIALSSGGRAPAVLRRLREDLAAALVTPAVVAFIDRVARMRDEPPQETRIARVKEAVVGFGLEVKVRFPAWFTPPDDSRLRGSRRRLHAQPLSKLSRLSDFGALPSMKSLMRGSVDARNSSGVPARTMRPLWTIARRSATAKAPFMSCVTTMLVTASSCCMPSTRWLMRSELIGSSPVVGSS